MLNTLLQNFPSFVITLGVVEPYAVAFFAVSGVLMIGMYFSVFRHAGTRGDSTRSDPKSKKEREFQKGEFDAGSSDGLREARSVEKSRGKSAGGMFVMGTLVSVFASLSLAGALYGFLPSIFQQRSSLGDSNLLVSGGGRVLAAEDDRPEGVPSAPMFESENFKIGHIAVGGESEIFFPNPETEQIEVSALSYRLVNDKDSGDTGVVVEWSTNKPTIGEVYYRKHSETDYRVVSEEKYNIEHELFLDDIETENTYVLYAKATDRWGNEKQGESYALYSGANTASLFDLLSDAFGDLFGWARR